MATIAEWDGGTLPTIVGTSPTVSGNMMQFAAGSALNYAAWTISSSQCTLRFYITVGASWAASSWSLAVFRASTAEPAKINQSGSGTPGQLRFTKTGGTQFANSATNSIAVSTTYRVEVQVDRAAQTYRAAIFPLLSDTALYDTGALTAVDTGAAAFSELRLGITSAGVSVPAFSIGRVKAVDSVGSWIGRHASDYPADPTLIAEWAGGALPTIVGTAPTVDSDGFMAFASDSASAYASWASSTDTFTARFYAKLPAAWPSASASLFVSNNASGNVDRVNLAGSGSPGQLRFVKAGNVQVANTPANAVSLSQMVRVEMQVNRVAQTMRAAVFPIGADRPLYDTGLMSTIDSGASAFTSFLLGRVTSGVTFPIAIGRVKIITTIGAWIGRHSSDPLLIPEALGIKSGPGAVYPVEVLGEWNGSSIVPATILDIA